MNFKEVYSKANDEIHGSEVLLSKILSAPAKKSFRIPAFVPVVAVAAMIAVVIAVPYLTKTRIDTDLNINVASGITQDADAGATDLKTESAVITPEETENNPEDMPVVENSTVTESGVETGVAPVADEPMSEPEVQIYFGETAVSDLAEAEPLYNGIPETASEVVEEIQLPETEDTVVINYVEQLAGAEATVMSRGVAQKPMKEMTEEEYIEYIGTDVAKTAAIPDDMTMEAPEFISAETDEEGEIVSEKGIYFAHSEDYERFAEINVTRTQDILIPEEGLEKSEICGNQVIIVSDNTDYNASFSENDVQFFIRTGGVTEQEFENLLISLNGGSTND